MNDPSRNSFWLGVDLAQHTFDASRASGAAPLEDNDKARIHCLVAVMRKLLLVARSVLVHRTPYDPTDENYA